MNYFKCFLILLTYFAGGYAIREALPEEFPFQVSIKSLNNRHLCGGAILTSKWVLTSSSCVEHFSPVIVSYGSVDSNIPLNSIKSSSVIIQRDSFFGKKSRLALINLESAVEFSKTVAQAKLPVEKVTLPETAKLSGWKVDHVISFPPNLYVTDKCRIITGKCKTSADTEVELAVDEFCVEDENEKNELAFAGTTASKAGIVLGLLPSTLLNPNVPAIFVRLSEHEQWIKDTLGSEAQYVTWVDKVPKNSATTQTSLNFILIGIFTFFHRFL